MLYTTVCRTKLVPRGGVEPPSRVYESLVLTVELHRQVWTHTKVQLLSSERKTERQRVLGFAAWLVA